ncbi:Uncharacterized protein Y057_14044 [Fusarium fujikuroi]|nr:Uncharacterized protein Y057_14044 [Fusarium fujikuroi]
MGSGNQENPLDGDKILDEHYLNNTQRAASVQTFDRDIHAHIGTRESVKNMRLVKDESKRVRYFTLTNKENGSCELKPLSSTSCHLKKCMFCPELVVGVRLYIRDIQRAHVRDSITELLNKIVEDLEKLDSLVSSGLSETDSSAAHQISVPENGTTAASDGEMRILQNIDGLLKADEAEMNPSNLESRVEPVVEESIRKIRHLGGNGTTMAAAPTSSMN